MVNMSRRAAGITLLYIPRRQEKTKRQKDMAWPLETVGFGVGAGWRWDGILGGRGAGVRLGSLVARDFGRLSVYPILSEH